MNNDEAFTRLKRFYSKYKTQREVIEGLLLMAIIDSYGRVKGIRGIERYSENRIRDEFVRDFERQSPYLKGYIANRTIKLTNENRILLENETFRTDIEFFIGGYGDFVVECKRLIAAEQRYIRGGQRNEAYQVDGIERFTSLAYARRDACAGMVAFVVAGEIRRIMGALIAEIRKFRFCSAYDGLLTEPCSNWQDSFQSRHTRIDDTEIHIYHLFFNFAQN